MSKKNNTARVALVKGKDRYSTITKALKLIAGDIKPGKKILIKPDITMVSRPLANTHVDAVCAVVDFFMAGTSFDIVIAESTGTGSVGAKTGYEKLRYNKIKYRDRIKFVDLNKDAVVEVTILDSNFNPVKIRLAKTVVESDFRISICPPKNDNCVLYSGALKNMIMGSIIRKERILEEILFRIAIRLMRQIPVNYPAWIAGITGNDKMKMHQGYQAMNLNMYKLASIIPPHLSVIDGFNAMEGNGPIYGNNVSFDACLVSTDFVACDAMASWLMGFDINRIGYLNYCSKAMLGEGDILRIKVLGENPGKCMVPIKPHEKWIDQLKWIVDNPEGYFLWLSTR
ncbi:MAG: DUF362 domain-containing protein [Chloroflexi bacterium]|nr:DUF362 domain-containing protein [Chloroflexota bacterium]